MGPVSPLKRQDCAGAFHAAFRVPSTPLMMNDIVGVCPVITWDSRACDQAGDLHPLPSQISRVTSMRISSDRFLASIFSITRARCTSTVDWVICISLAMALLR